MKDKNKKIIKELSEYALIIIGVLLFRMFLYSPVRVTGDSMVPTLNDGNLMILNKIGYRINGLNRFDIVVINNDGEKIIKRVIGMPGEYVQYKDNKLYINGEYVKEEYKRDDMEDLILQEIRCTKEKIECNKIPEDMYLVLGDNRGISKDSRSIGLINKKNIKGYTSIVFFPFNKIGKVN